MASRRQETSGQERVVNATTGRGANHLFILGMLVGSACGLVLGSALGLELRRDRIRAIKRLVKRLTGQQDRPRFDLMV